MPHNASSSPEPQQRKKALLIGVKGTLQADSAKLQKTHNDVRIMKELLINHYNYEEKSIVTLLDCRLHPTDRYPTKENILRELEALVADAQPHDRLFFYYAGHVDQKETDDPREEDGLNEYMLPCDSSGVDNNAIQDDVLREILIENLPPRCTLTAVFDACHSGTLLDLDHWRCNRGRLKFPFRLERGKRHTMHHHNGE
jgi:metacaspase-1